MRVALGNSTKDRGLELAQSGGTRSNLALR